MTLVLADRVQETTTTTGTGSITTSGTAAAQCQTFAAGIGTGNTTYYCIQSGDGTNWETGIGTVTTSGSVSTIARSVLASSNSNALVSLTGTSTVFCDLPASKYGVFTNLTATGTTTLTSVTATTPVVVNANAASAPSSAPLTVLQVVGAAASGARVVVDGFAGTPQFTGRRADGTVASPSAVQSGENLFNINAIGYGATGYGSNPRGVFALVAAENWSDTAQGCYLAFQTTAATTVTTNEKMRFTSVGHLLIGTTTDDGTNLLQVAGGLQATTHVIGASTGPTVTSGTGAPSSTQPNASLFLRTDGSTGSRLYVSAGSGTWAAVASV